MCSCESPTPERPAPTQPPAPVQPCPPNCSLNATWVDTTAYCGDNVRVQAVITPAPPDGPATVEVLLPVSGGTPSVVGTISTSVVGGRVDATWVAKAASASWRTDQMQFRVNVPGATVTGISSNRFTFRQRPTVAWTTLNNSYPVNGGYSPIAEKHDAALEASRVHYRLKLRTHGDPFDATKQSAAKTLIENTWNNGFSNKKFHRTGCLRGATCDCTFDCCKATWRLDVEFVTSGEHVAVQIFATAPGTTPHRSHMGASGGDWGDPPRNPTTTYPHETGHVLGQFDEYPTGGTDPSGVQPATAPASESNLMSTTGNTTLLIRHYRRALKFLNDNAAGDTYATIQP